ncbi:DUF1127 domain-containing protein [Psychromarinibacter sp. C21-152]|uniref:DUF1127 domain-containing protein n=1 Tax=Psychromarinibacter sediminicola TaxID=3033385 RepID=A0AAE3T8A2_9RHOB|nr:DUF1127 domain-containing protein [Psychromarinibacter sediminicola]MDF0599874.1 DUF1127 domain-containing protein [Psychromarinibacter sediminicola]
MPLSARPHVLVRSAPRRRRGTLFGRLMALAALRRQRRTLAQLDDHLLQDIGVTRDAALRESQRPIWDAPAHWTD